MQEEIPRVPVVCTGNDFSTLYAPLIRDGRMEKFYWAPTREDRVGVCMGIFQHDNVDRTAVESLVDTFPGQSIDFFGALRARVYDDKVRLLPPGVQNLFDDSEHGDDLGNRAAHTHFIQISSISLDAIYCYQRRCACDFDERL